MTEKTLKIDCPMNGCREMAIVEVEAELEKMSDQERDSLLKQIRKRIETALRKHHKDGHPKGEGKK